MVCVTVFLGSFVGGSRGRWCGGELFDGDRRDYFSISSVYRGVSLFFLESVVDVVKKLWRR